MFWIVKNQNKWDADLSNYMFPSLYPVRVFRKSFFSSSTLLTTNATELNKENGWSFKATVGCQPKTHILVAYICGT